MHTSVSSTAIEPEMAAFTQSKVVKLLRSRAGLSRHLSDRSLDANKADSVAEPVRQRQVIEVDLPNVNSQAT